MGTFIDREADLPLWNAARAEGAAAGGACAAKAEDAGFDAEAAKEEILRALAESPFPLTGEELVDRCIAAGLVPHDARAFGPVIGSLARSKRIESVGFAARQKGHGTAGARLWAIVTEGGLTHGR